MTNWGTVLVQFLIFKIHLYHLTKSVTKNGKWSQHQIVSACLTIQLGWLESSNHETFFSNEYFATLKWMIQISIDCIWFCMIVFKYHNSLCMC
jgi:hypothetical protein